MIIEFIREWGINSVWVIAFGMLLIEIRHWYNSKQRDEKLEAVEKELQENKSRGDAPYFDAFSLRIPSPAKRLSPAFARGNWAYIKRIKDDYQGAIWFQMYNRGESIREFKFEFPKGYRYNDLKKVIDRDKMFEIEYTGRCNKVGKVIQFKIDFETKKGIQGTQIYEMVHGVCQLKRIHPN